MAHLTIPLNRGIRQQPEQHQTPQAESRSPAHSHTEIRHRSDHFKPRPCGINSITDVSRPPHSSAKRKAMMSEIEISQHLSGPSKVVVPRLEKPMECQTKDELEQHLSDIRRLASSRTLTPEEKDAAVRANALPLASCGSTISRDITARDAPSPHGLNDPEEKRGCECNDSITMSAPRPEYTLEAQTNQRARRKGAEHADYRL